MNAKSKHWKQTWSYTEVGDRMTSKLAVGEVTLGIGTETESEYKSGNARISSLSVTRDNLRPFHLELSKCYCI